jgi:carbon-monoxide dehydrogenase small subunit
MSEPKRLRLTVNGRQHEAVVESRTTLVDFLRGELGLGGTHVGCEHGVCGACTVLWNGRAVRSCIMLAVQADGADLMTVEGLTSGPHTTGAALHPIQQAFLEEHGLQCGFCTPGFLISIYELLGRSPDPSDAEIMDTLGGHICRCTGYQTIIAAVRSAAAKMRAAGSPRAPGDTR